MDFLGVIFLGIRVFDWLILIFLCYIFGRTTIISNQIANVHIDVNRERDEAELERFRQENRLDDSNLDDDTDKIIPSSDKKEEPKKEKKETTFIGTTFKVIFAIVGFIVIVGIVNTYK